MGATLWGRDGDAGDDSVRLSYEISKCMWDKPSYYLLAPSIIYTPFKLCLKPVL